MIGAAAGTPLTSSAFVGKFDESILGVRSNLVIRAANDGVVGSLNLTESNAVAIVAVARVDYAVLRPAAFCHISGLQLSA